MKKLDLYLLNSFLKKFFVFLLALIFIFIVINLFENLGNFLSKDASYMLILKHYLYKIPNIITVMLPVSLLLATLFSLNEFSKHNELVAMKASGISTYRIIAPLYIMGIFFAVFAFYFSNYIAPRAENISRTIKNEQILDRNYYDTGWKYDLAYLNDKGHFLFAEKYNIKSHTMYDVYYYLIKDDSVKEIWELKRLVWEENKWVGYNVEIKKFSDIQDDFFSNYERKDLDLLKNTPDDLVIYKKKTDELTLLELKKEISKRQKLGDADIFKLKTNLYFRYSFPLANLIVLLFGATFAVKGKQREQSYGVLASIGISFVYLMLIRFAEAFSYAGYLNPFIAAWIGNFVFMAVVFYFLVKAKYY